MTDNRSDTEDYVRHWYGLSQVAAFRNEPLYVTPEEFHELEGFGAEQARERERRYIEAGHGPVSLYPTFAGIEVVVDAEKAQEQRAHSDESRDR